MCRCMVKGDVQNRAERLLIKLEVRRFMKIVMVNDCVHVGETLIRYLPKD